MGILRIWKADLSQREDLRSTVGVGTPILTDAAHLFRLENGEELAGQYRLEFVTGTVVPGVSAQVRVVCEDVSFYRHNDVFTVALDGVTAYTNIIPGLSIVFTSDAGFTDLWYILIDIGDFLGTVDAGNPLGVPPGSPVLERRYAVKNEGGTNATGCYVVLRPQAKLVRTSGDGLLKSIKVVTNAPVERADPSTTQTLPYVLTAANTSGGLLDIHQDGAVITQVRNMTTGVVSTSTALSANGITRYRIESGNLSGIEFVIAAGANNSSTCNVLVFSLAYVEVAPDLAGSPGVYTTADTQIGTAGYPAGTIPAGAYAYFWIRITIPSGAGGQSNPYPMDALVRYRDQGPAAWGAP